MAMGAYGPPKSFQKRRIFGNFNAFHAFAVSKEKGIKLIGKSLNLVPYLQMP